jgi:hypothetical protein
VIVTELNIERIPIRKAEADPPLVIDRDGVLPGAVAFERMQPIAGRDLQVGQRRGDMNGFKLTEGSARHIRRDALRLAGPKELLRLTIREGLDHAEM